MKQEQFLEVLDRDEAERRWHATLELAPLGSERIPLPASEPSDPDADFIQRF